MINLLIPVLLVASSVWAFVSVIKPTFGEAQVLHAKVSEYDAALGKSKQLLTLRNTLQQKYNAIGNVEKQRLEKLLPDTVDNVRLILDINTMAAKYGMVIKAITIGQDATPVPAVKTGVPVVSDQGFATARQAALAEKNYGTITLQFSVAGSYDTFMQFLEDLERSLRLVDITDLDFKTDDRGVTQYSVALKTYWLK